MKTVTVTYISKDPSLLNVIREVIEKRKWHPNKFTLITATISGLFCGLGGQIWAYLLNYSLFLLFLPIYTVLIFKAEKHMPKDFRIAAHGIGIITCLIFLNAFRWTAVIGLWINSSLFPY